MSLIRLVRRVEKALSQKEREKSGSLPEKTVVHLFPEHERM